MLETSKNVVWQSADRRVTSDHCRVTVQWHISQNFLIAWNIQKRCLTVGRRSRDLDHCRVTVQRLFSKFSQIAWNVQKTLFDSRPTVAWPQPLSRDRSATFFKFFPNRLKSLKNVVWQSADGRVTSTTVAWPVSDFFQNFSKSLETSKNVVWQSAGSRVTSDHCRVTVQRLFSKFSQIAWNVQKTLFDSWPTVAWPPTTVAWPFSDFFQNFPKSLETSKKRCLTVGRRSRYLRPLSRDRSATFFKIFPNRLKRPKNVVWQSADGRVTSDHCRVTVQPLFSKFSQIAWNVQKTLFDSRPTVAWPQPLSRDRSATFFKIFPNRLKRLKNVVWQSAGSRVTSDHCHVTVQRLFSKKFLIAWNVQKTWFDSRPTVAWPQPLSRDRSATFFKIFPNRLKRPKNVVWQSADGRVTSDHCRVTVQPLFSKFSQIAWNVQKRCLTVGRRSRDLRTLSRDRSATFFKIFPNRLKRPKNVVWQSADGRVTSTTVAWPFSDFFQNFPKSLETSKKRCLTVGLRSRDLRPLSRDRSATFFKIFPNRLKRPKNVVWQSADGRVTSDHCRVTVQRLFSKKISNCLKRRKIVVWQSAESRVTSDHCHVTVQRLLSKKFLIAWNVEKSLFDSRPMVAWPPTTLARHHILPRRCISRYYYFLIRTQPFNHLTIHDTPFSHAYHPINHPNFTPSFIISSKHRHGQSDTSEFFFERVRAITRYQSL